MYLVFDTETTGLPANFQAPITDSANWPRLVELAWGLYDEHGDLHSAGQMLVRPEGFAIPAEATHIHGITHERATNEGVSLAQALVEIVAATEECQCLVAHNLEYDLAIVGAELHRLGQSNFGEGLQLACTMRMGTGLELPGGRGSKPPKLHELHEALFEEELEGAHRAEADVAACARCFFELLSRGVQLKAPNTPVQPAKSKSKTTLPVLDLDNREFQLALNLIENTNKNIFLTGKAGTGKSTFLRYIVAHTRKKAIVVAPTGVAALNAGGTTIHRMFGLPFGIIGPKEKLRDFRYTNNQEKHALLKAVELVIIDEVSMVRADILDAIDRSLRTNCMRPKDPFGGKQVLLVGDAYQLPPVLTNTDAQLFAGFNYSTRYFFGAKVFEDKAYSLISIELRKAYRQQNEQFVQLLDRVRTNQAREVDLKELNSRMASATKVVGRCITLCTRNKDAEDYNANELTKLTAPLVKFIGVVTGDFSESELPTARELVLKEGAQVMFVRNDRYNRWVNGTIGRVLKLEKGGAEVEIEDGATYSVERETWDKFSYGLDEKTGSITRTVVGTFNQLPLKLAWALTVHKSQGLTFDAVEIDAPTGFFEAGQLYVALSRCRSFEGLQLRTPVRSRDVMVSREVVELHRTANDEQQVADALAEARPNMLYQQSLKLLDQGSLRESVASFCKALNLRNDAHKPLFARLIQHKLHGYIQARKVLDKLRPAYEAILAETHVKAAMQVIESAQKQEELANLQLALDNTRAQSLQENQAHQAELEQKELEWGQERYNLRQEIEQTQLGRQAEQQKNIRLEANMKLAAREHMDQLLLQENSANATLSVAYEAIAKLEEQQAQANRQIERLKKSLEDSTAANEQLKKAFEEEILKNRPWWKKMKDKF